MVCPNWLVSPSGRRRRRWPWGSTLQLGTPAGDAEAATPSATNRLSLSEVEVRTLRKAIGRETFDHWGWHADDTGRVLSETGQPVFGPGFITALKKVVEFVEK